jgi:hypothetical protein
MTSGPNYSFEKVLDVAEAFPHALIPNDRGHALLVADPAGTSGRCLLRHRGATTEPVACTRNIDDESPFTSIQEAHWNEGGTIVLRGSVYGIPGSSESQVQVIEPNGGVFALQTGTFPQQKRNPVISGGGNVFYVEEQAGLGLLQRYVPTRAGNDKSETVPDANGVISLVSRVEPASVEGRLYFNAPGKRVGSVENALNSLAGPPPPLPYYTAFEVSDAFFSVPTPNRFGALVYSTATEIRKRFDVGGTDFVAGDPEFIIETTGSPDAPIVTSSAALAGPCKVALFGHARGLCTRGPHDGLVCDPDEFPDPCSTGIGGPDDGFCQDDVQGIFVHQAGTYAAIAREGDAMLGSTVQDFFNSVSPTLFVVGSNAGHIFFPVRLADGRELIVRSQGAGAAGTPVMPTSCAGLACDFDLEPQGWIGVGPNGVPIYFDPDIATGYDYEIAPGDPHFASAIVPEPLPNGDASFTLLVGEESFPIEAGEQFDLTQITPLGVAAFSIRDIDPEEQLDPEAHFVTGVTFMEEREANVTMTAVVPEPGAMALGAAVFGALAALARRRRLVRR